MEEVLKDCEKIGLEYISITDHNTCAAYYEEAFTKNKFFTGKIIKGCEISAGFQNKSIEILAYKINTHIIMNWKEKYHSAEKYKENTQRVYKRFLSALDKKGIIYNENNIRLENKNGFIERPIWEEVISHQENKEIVGVAYFTDFRIFFRKELANPKSEYFLNKVNYYPSAKEVVDIIHEAGGKAFLAHPFEYEFKNTIGFIENLTKSTSLDGIECFHPSASEEQRKILVDFAKNNELYISGGSDFHGARKPDIRLGVGRGDLCISKEILEWN